MVAFSKVFVISIALLTASVTFTKVQFNVRAELKNSVLYGNRTMDTTFQIREKESLEIYNHENIYIIAALIAEKEMNATVCFTIYTKNKQGEFETIMAPVLVTSYSEDTTVSMGSKINARNELDEYFGMTVTAQKV